MQLINSFAFKNTMDIRKQMKNLQLFEMRDDLMIDIIRHCSHSQINEGPSKDIQSPKKQQSKFTLISTHSSSHNTSA